MANKRESAFKEGSRFTIVGRVFARIIRQLDTVGYMFVLARRRIFERMWVNRCLKELY